MNKRKLILLIVGILFVFILGGGSGVYYKTQEEAEGLRQNQSQMEIASNFVNSFEALEYSAIVVFGDVVSIDNNKREIEIAVREIDKSFKIKIKEGTNIYYSKLPYSSEETTVDEKLNPTLEDIKIGDRLNINIKLLSNGKIESQSIAILK